MDGELTNGTLRMSNEEEISRMYQEDPGEIIKLNRDIQLKNMISANYGERAWNALADQIIWQSGDSGVASVNYQEGSYYSNIETFPYISYRPTTDFGILGRQNGQTTITATHKVTGLEENVAVTVNTLKDKLYLFQLYPRKETKLVFTTGAGKLKHITSDQNGAATLYLPASEGGIAGNVYCYNSTHRGTIYAENLRSGEGTGPGWSGTPATI